MDNASIARPRWGRRMSLLGRVGVGLEGGCRRVNVCLERHCDCLCCVLGRLYSKAKMGQGVVLPPVTACAASSTAVTARPSPLPTHMHTHSPLSDHKHTPSPSTECLTPPAAPRPALSRPSRSPLRTRRTAQSASSRSWRRSARAASPLCASCPRCVGVGVGGGEWGGMRGKCNATGGGVSMAGQWLGSAPHGRQPHPLPPQRLCLHPDVVTPPTHP